MDMTLQRRRLVLALIVLALSALMAAAVATAKTSHAGWPRIDGRLLINKQDQSTPLIGLKDKHNELLGGHGNDTLKAGQIGDVLWGDYKPSGNTTTQVDHIDGGAGKDFIYASHGTNVIDGHGGADQIHAHFGHGTITCGSAKATVFLSHKGRSGWTLHGCAHISYKTVGY